jgi:anti-sigma-K factor RskA
MNGRRTGPGCGQDAAPYVLGALEPAEARAFARHLEGCASCREEVAALAPVLDALPSSVPAQRVPRALRRRVLRAVREEPKAVERGRPRRVRPAAATPRAGWLALGAAVAAALVLQLAVGRSQDRVITASVGQARLRVAGGHGELVVEHLPPLPPDRTYELWLVGPGAAPRPSTLFAVTARGTADVGVPGELGRVRGLLVTVEPRGGSLAPTRRPVIVERLA